MAIKFLDFDDHSIYMDDDFGGMSISYTDLTKILKNMKKRKPEKFDKIRREVFRTKTDDKNGE